MALARLTVRRDRPDLARPAVARIRGGTSHWLSGGRLDGRGDDVSGRGDDADPARERDVLGGNADGGSRGVAAPRRRRRWRRGRRSRRPAGRLGRVRALVLGRRAPTSPWASSPSHAVRSCLIGMRMAAQLDLPANERSDLFYALLLKDAGCSANSNRMAMLFAADDRAAKATSKLVDWT